MNKYWKIRKDKYKVIIAEWKKDTTRRIERKVLERDSEGEREEMNKKARERVKENEKKQTRKERQS